MVIFYALAQAFGALGGDDGKGIFSMLAKGFGGGRASGGPVEPNTTYLVGEKGPELLTMGSSGGHVTSNEGMKSAMQRYSPAGGGRAAADGGGGAAGAQSGGSVSIDYTGPVLNFNGDEYLPKSAVPELINAAAKKGADGGYAKTMGAMRNSRSTRSRIGLR